MLYKRNETWWVRFTAPDGTRIRRSAKTTNKVQAQEFLDKLKAELWRSTKLDEKPDRNWEQAVVRWLKEAQHKASTENDKIHLRWVDPYLRGLTLSSINRDLIDQIIQDRLAENVSNATVNRMLAVIRSILRKAEREWEWLGKAPYIKLLPEPKRRIRWLTRQEAQTLLSFLPDHLEAMARFSLLTGLRKSNVTGLKWSQVDMARAVAWIHVDQAKACHSIHVPLNNDALDVLQNQLEKHHEYVFTYRGNRIQQVNTKAWRKALQQANIDDFRWHDLRHNWASWHVQQGTPLAVLQELGGWESAEMVRRYAHLGNEHTSSFANQLSLQDEGVPKKPNLWHKSGTNEDLDFDLNAVSH